MGTPKFVDERETCLVDGPVVVVGDPTDIICDCIDISGYPFRHYDDIMFQTQVKDGDC